MTNKINKPYKVVEIPTSYEFSNAVDPQFKSDDDLLSPPSNTPPCTLQSNDAGDTYQCEFCVKTFHSRKNLVDHVNDHVPGAIFKCYQCDKSFPTNISLSHHIKNQHSDNLLANYQTTPPCQQGRDPLPLSPQEYPPNYACYGCGKLFLSHSDLVDHLQIEHGNKTVFTCQMCSNCFGSLADLNGHKLVYHGINEQQFF